MPKHGAADFLQNIFPDMDNVVGGDPHQVEIIGAVVNLAEGETVINTREAVNVRIRNDVSRVEQARMTELADRAGDLVCAKYSSSKRGLMQSRSVGSLGVPPQVLRNDERVSEDFLVLVECDGECSRIFIVGDNVYGILRDICPFSDSLEIDEGVAGDICGPQLAIVSAIAFSIVVRQKHFSSNGVRIRAGTAGHDRQRRREVRWVSDTPASIEKRDPNAVEMVLGEFVSRELIFPRELQVVQPAKDVLAYDILFFDGSHTSICSILKF